MFTQQEGWFDMNAIPAEKKATRRRGPITRESKKEKTKTAIIMAALELFERQGFEQTTVDAIAAAAEVSTRTFYRYFPTKDDVVFPYHDGYVAKFCSLLKTRHAKEPPLEIVRRALRSMAELYVATRTASTYCSPAAATPARRRQRRSYGRGIRKRVGTNMTDCQPW